MIRDLAPEHRVNTAAPKYSHPEIERHWLVPESALGQFIPARPYRLIEDRCILGTRLRLRKVEGEA